MSILDVDDVASFLKVTDTETKDRLQVVLDAAELRIAKRIGLRQLAATEVTEQVTAGANGIGLTRRPVVSVVSLAGAGGGLGFDVSALDANTLTSGLVRLVNGRAFSSSVYTVTYRAGFVGALPEDLELAVKEMTRYLLRPQRGAGGRGANAPTPNDTPASLKVVDELLGDYVPMDGFA